MIHATNKLFVPNYANFPQHSGHGSLVPLDYENPDWTPRDWNHWVRFISKEVQAHWHFFDKHERYILAGQAHWLSQHFVFEHTTGRNSNHAG